MQSDHSTPDQSPHHRDTQRVGANAEHYARQWLEARGLKYIEKNYHCRFGELDLIMQDHRELVFIEVRFRSHEGFGTAADSVHVGKQQKLVRSAIHYLHARGLSDEPARIDVLGLHALRPNAIEWIKNAVSTD